MLLLQAITQIWLLWLLSLHVVIYLQNEFKHKPKMAFYMYNVLYGSAVSFMRGKLKLLFLLGDNNGPTSSITILKITYKLSWCLIGIVTFKESLFQLESFRDISLFFPWNPYLQTDYYQPLYSLFWWGCKTRLHEIKKW